MKRKGGAFLGEEEVAHPGYARESAALKELLERNREQVIVVPLDEDSLESGPDKRKQRDSYATRWGDKKRLKQRIVYDDDEDDDEDRGGVDEVDYEDDTIETLRRAEEANATKLGLWEPIAVLTGQDNKDKTLRWSHDIRVPCAQAYINIGRGHGEYPYPLHLDLSESSHAQSVSRLHASLRYNVINNRYEVQVHGKNGVYIDGTAGPLTVAQYDDHVWRPLLSQFDYGFLIGEVKFRIQHVRTEDFLLRQRLKALAQYHSKDEPAPKTRAVLMLDLWTGVEDPAEEGASEDQAYLRHGAAVSRVGDVSGAPSHHHSWRSQWRPTGPIFKQFAPLYGTDDQDGEEGDDDDDQIDDDDDDEPVF